MYIHVKMRTPFNLSLYIILIIFIKEIVHMGNMWSIEGRKLKKAYDNDMG